MSHPIASSSRMPPPSTSRPSSSSHAYTNSASSSSSSSGTNPNPNHHLNPTITSTSSRGMDRTSSTTSSSSTLTARPLIPIVPHGIPSHSSETSAARGLAGRASHHPGCVLCGVVSTASASSQASRLTGSSLPSTYHGSHAPTRSYSSNQSQQSDGTPSPSPTVTTFLQSQSQSKSQSQSRDHAQVGSDRLQAQAGSSTDTNAHTDSYPYPYPQPFAPSSSDPLPSPSGASSSSSSNSTRTGPGRDILFHDDEITVYAAAAKERLCSDGRHLIVVMNRHVERVYDLGPADIPILSHMISTAENIFAAQSLSGHAPSSASTAEEGGGGREKLEMRIGFVGSIVRDPQSPHAHLHAHALFGPIDTSLPGATLWRRSVVFGGMNWWSLEDLRAEIRESSSNNRIKSGYTDRRAPINRVPDAGAVSGPPNALEPDPYADHPTSHALNRSDSSASASASASMSTSRKYGKSRETLHPVLERSNMGLQRSGSTSSRHGLIPGESPDEPRASVDGYAEVDLRQGAV